MHVWILGYPGHMGGANTECWHTVRLWREAGIDVTLIPTWGSDDHWRGRLDAIGAVTYPATPDTLANVPGLAGGIVVSMCNGRLWPVYPTLRRMCCKVVWVNCMTFCFDGELQAVRSHGVADAYVYQSEYQRSCLEPVLAPLGYTPDRGHLIRGAFHLAEFPFCPRPHPPGTEFIIGRLARPDLDKWSSNHWPILSAVPYRQRRSLNMGWSDHLQRKLGKPPAWAEVLPPQSISSREFLARCHALLGLNGGARENWPRVGLEAMAAGVPIVAQAQWGWREMVDHAITGYLAADDQEMEYYLADLAYREDVRMAMAEAGRARVQRLADPETLSGQWIELFRRLI